MKNRQSFGNPFFRLGRIFAMILPFLVVMWLYGFSRIRHLECDVGSKPCPPKYFDHFSSLVWKRSSLRLKPEQIRQNLLDTFPELTDASISLTFANTASATLSQAEWLAQDLSASTSSYLVVTATGAVIETDTDPGLLSITTPQGWWQPGQSSFPEEAVAWLKALMPMRNQIVAVDISKPWEITIVSRDGQQWKGNLLDDPHEALKEIAYIRSHYPGTPPIIDVRFERPVLSESTSPVD